MIKLRAVLGTSVFVLSLLATSVALVKLEHISFKDAGAVAGKPRPGYAAAISLPQIDSSAIEAESYIVATASGVILNQKEPEKPLPIASLTKIMTALILEEYGGKSVILISDTAKNTPPKESGLPAGETITKDAAKILLLVESDNDVAEAVAASIGSSIKQDLKPRNAFLLAMNKKASSLGMRQTRFRNPTGLDEEGHNSSAADMAVLLGYIDATHHNFWDATYDPPDSISGLSGKSYAVKSSSLLGAYPGLLGIKTGLTDEAMGALALKYRLTEFPEDIYIVLLRSPDRFRDGEKLLAAVRRAFQAEPK